MLARAALSSILLSLVAANPVAHAHDKRAVVVVTQTVITYVTAGHQVVPDAATASTLAASTAEVEVATVPVVTPSTTATAATTTAAAETTSASLVATTTLSTASASAVATPTSGGSAGAKGITYSPYNADGTCKDLAAVKLDLAKISDYGIIRLYGVDCLQVENVLQAKGSSQKIFAGIYFVDAISAGISTLASAVSLYGSWDDIYTVSIGNELVNGGQASVSQVGSYVSEGRSALTAAGYTGPVVSVDTFIATINNPGLCEFSDYIAVNAHAFFDGGVTADNAGEWVLQQIQRVWTACGSSKSVLITESGWPSQGETNGQCVPSESNQAAAISSIKSACGDDVLLFNAFNDLWKAPGAYNAEQYWGILN